MTQVKTCLWFDTMAEDAARFYTSVIPNSAVHHVERYAADIHGRTAGTAMMVEFSLNCSLKRIANPRGGMDSALLKK